MQRSAVAVALGWLLVASMILAAGHAAAELPATATVTDSQCAEYGDVASVTLRVSLQTNSAVTVHAHTWDQKRHVQHAWTPSNVTLEPGVSIVTFQAPNPEAAITGGAHTQLALNSGQKRVITNWRARRCPSKNPQPTQS